MPEVWKTIGLCDRVGERSNIITATCSECEADCYLHGMFPEEKVVSGSNWLRNADKRNSFHLMGFSVPFKLRNSFFEVVMLA
jgi:hypothetical protein